MKRLFTIFLSSVVGMSLWGQNVPVSIWGDVYVDATGEMMSQGAVHLEAVSGTVRAKVANDGTMKADSIVFYSNDSIDGLLQNLGSVEPVTNTIVVVRKTFKNQGYYQISFPFDVNLTSGVVDPATGNAMVLGTDFYVRYYDSQARADNGQNTFDNWKTIPAGTTVLSKGLGYRFALDTKYPAGSSVDFTTAISTNVNNFFGSGEKTVPLVYYPSNVFVGADSIEGWNALGGLYSTNYFFDNSSPTYAWNHTVWYWDAKSDATGKWSGLPALPTGDKGILRPYADIFVQTTDATNASGGFKYKGGSTGLTLNRGNETNPNIPLFRSSQNASGNGNDVLELDLSNANNSILSSPAYFTFNQTFSKFYKKTEDDFLLETKNAITPIVWSIGEVDGSNTKYNLYVNSLPSGENEVPLGVNIPTAGEYVFSLKEHINQNIKSALLLDKTNGVQTELLTNDYSFQYNGPVRNEDRFVLFFNRSVTSIEPLPGAAAIYAYTNNNVLTVKNLLDGDKVQVMDMTGRTVATGKATSNTYSVTLNQKGVYIVRVGESKTLKVLNK